jgi:hypothetical protein
MENLTKLIEIINPTNEDLIEYKDKNVIFSSSLKYQYSLPKRIYSLGNGTTKMVTIFNK